MEEAVNARTFFSAQKPKKDSNKGSLKLDIINDKDNQKKRDSQQIKSASTTRGPQKFAPQEDGLEKFHIEKRVRIKSNIKKTERRIKRLDSLSGGIQDISYSDSTESEEENVPAEAREIQKMRDFYDINFNLVELYSIKDKDNGRIWKVQFDEGYDLIYIFYGQLELESEAVSSPQEPFRGDDSKTKTTKVQFLKGDKDGTNLFGTLHEEDEKDSSSSKPSANTSSNPHSSSDSSSNSYSEQQELTFQIHKVNVFFQVWNVEDRILNSGKGQRGPICEQKVLTKQVKLEDYLSISQKMERVQSLFQDSAQLMQHAGKVHIFKNSTVLLTFDIQSRTMWKNNFNFTSNEDKDINPCAQQSTLFFKENSQQVESILQFSYYQHIAKDNNKTDVSEAAVSQYGTRKQRFGLRVLWYNDILHNKRGYPKIKELTCAVEDTNLYEYYDSGYSLQTKSFFLQRIKGTSTYIVLFPTGIIFQLSTQPLTVQAKMQLNIRKDEIIQDIAYCIDDTGNHHCLWLIDEKNQVWKCMNELNANSCNWTISKFSILQYPTNFFDPAVTYLEPYFMTDIFKLASMKTVAWEQNQNFMFSTNVASTKLTIIQQPAYSKNLMDGDLSSISNSTTPLRKEKDIDSSQHIRVFILFKMQSIIANKIERKDPENKGFKLIHSQAQVKSHDFKAKLIRELGNYTKQMMTTGQVDIQKKKSNDIIEVVYIGTKVQPFRSFSLASDSFKNAVYSQPLLSLFLLYKKYGIQLLVTNGITYSKEFIVGGENPQTNITNILYSANRETFGFQYNCGVVNQSKVEFYRKSGNGDLVEAPQTVQVDDLANKVIQDGELRVDEVFVEIRQKVNGFFVDNRSGKLTIIIPENYIGKDLLTLCNFQNLIISPSKRLLVGTYAIILLNSNIDEVDDIGCFIKHKVKQEEKFSYFSFLKSKERKFIANSLQLDRLDFLRFGSENMTKFDKDGDYLYTLHFEDDSHTDETQVLKITCSNLMCREIHLSRSTVQYMDLLIQSGQQQTPVSLCQLGMVGQDKQVEKCVNQFKGASIALLSQKQRSVIIEVLAQEDEEEIIEVNQVVPEEPEHNTFSNDDSNLIKDEGGPNEASKSQQNNPVQKESRIQTKERSFKLKYLLMLSVKDFLFQMGTVTWAADKKLLITLNDCFYIINLEQNDLTIAKNHLFHYGVQMVNMGMFCSIIRVRDKQNFDPSAQQNYNTDRINQLMLSAQQCIVRMDMACLRKYLILKSLTKMDDRKMSLIFFTPSEELQGSNIFGRLAHNFKIIQPFLDKIDSNFIEQMNQQIQNIQIFVDSAAQQVNGGQKKVTLGEESLTKNEVQKLKGQSNSIRGLVHMYQTDIMGCNAIDYAFQRNAIFCIKAFVETLMFLPDEDLQFRNCFDKALLLMIKRGISVKQLVNSELFYPTIWKQMTLFSSVKDVQISPYNNELADLESEGPSSVFNEPEQDVDEDDDLFAKSKKLSSRRLLYLSMTEKAEDKEEEFEMQYRFIYMEKIQGDSKIEVSRTLKDTEDFELFGQESIQNIIDYKWNTYAREYFFQKFLLYSLFLVLYYLDMESINYPDENGNRIKGWYFYTMKFICACIQFFFFSYELFQVNIEGAEYFEDPWNYMELGGNALFFWGATLDIYRDEISANMRIIFAISIIFTLIKVVYLIRVFRQLNFLVTMFITVVNEIKSFMILFLIFILTFAKAFHLIGVDITSYGRTPQFVAHFISVLRIAMGDFALIDPYQGFDIIDYPDREGDDQYRHSFLVVMVTWCIWLLCIFYLFMIFMNFIIAVIGESYSKVIQSKEAFDYQQRACMIYEREVQFAPNQFFNPKYFPKILVVKKMKENMHINNKNSWQNMLAQLKTSLSEITSKIQDELRLKTNEQKQHMSIRLMSIEKNLSVMNAEIKQVWILIQRNFQQSLFRQQLGNHSESDSCNFSNSMNQSNFLEPMKQQNDKQTVATSVADKNEKDSCLKMPSREIKRKGPSLNKLQESYSKAIRDSISQEVSSVMLEDRVFQGKDRSRLMKTQSEFFIQKKNTQRRKREMSEHGSPQLTKSLDTKIEALQNENRELKSLVQQILAAVSEKQTPKVVQTEEMQNAIDSAKDQMMEEIKKQAEMTRLELKQEIKEAVKESQANSQIGALRQELTSVRESQEKMEASLAEQTKLIEQQQQQKEEIKEWDDLSHQKEVQPPLDVYQKLLPDDFTEQTFSHKNLPSVEDFPKTKTTKNFRITSWRKQPSRQTSRNKQHRKRSQGHSVPYRIVTPPPGKIPIGYIAKPDWENHSDFGHFHVLPPPQDFLENQRGRNHFPEAEVGVAATQQFDPSCNLSLESSRKQTVNLEAAPIFQKREGYPLNTYHGQIRDSAGQQFIEQPYQSRIAMMTRSSIQRGPLDQNEELPHFPQYFDRKVRTGSSEQQIEGQVAQQVWSGDPRVQNNMAQVSFRQDNFHNFDRHRQ